MYRLLTIQVKSADVFTTRRSLFYVKLQFNPEKKLKTRSVPNINLARVSWDEGFVFAIPQEALSDKKSSIMFEIFRKNSFLKDSLLGKVEAKLDILANIFEVPEYDTEDEDLDEKFPEMKKMVKMKMEKANLEVEMVVSKGALSKVGKGGGWDGFAMELDEFFGNKQEDVKGDNNKKLFACFA